MTNSPILAKLLQARCNGQHEHERLEGPSRTKQAESYPIPLVKAILNKIHQTKRMKMDANMAKDPLHMQIPEMFWQCEDNIKVSCTRKSMSRYDIKPPIDVSWDSVVVRRTIDRKTGVVMAEDVRCSLDTAQIHRPFKGESPKKVLTVFFSWEETPIIQSVSSKATPGDKARYDAISAEILQQYSQNIRFIPRSTYRKAIGEGVRTITYGAHTSNAASGKSGKHVTLITESVNHNPILTLCHRLATTMPKPFPYLSITVVLLTDVEELSPHKDIQNHRLHQNATISFGKWTGGVLQILEDDKWINCDSKDQWVFLNARETYHRGGLGLFGAGSAKFHRPCSVHWGQRKWPQTDKTNPTQGSFPQNTSDGAKPILEEAAREQTLELQEFGGSGPRHDTPKGFFWFSQGSKGAHSPASDSISVHTASFHQFDWATPPPKVEEERKVWLGAKSTLHVDMALGGSRDLLLFAHARGSSPATWVAEHPHRHPMFMSPKILNQKSHRPPNKHKPPPPPSRVHVSMVNIVDNWIPVF